MNERSLFLAALDIEDRSDRTAFLDRACGAEPEVRERVRALLDAHDSIDEFMDRPASRLIDDDDGRRPREGPGHVIDDFVLMETIGEGGFGVVYLAEQRPVRRAVALKLLKPGMDTRQVVARFEAERQALALMDHPNIARIFGGGEAPSGRPYFVMELVHGRPITAYCRSRDLPLRDRLELFVTVCRAVEHAHQKGIIHRDIKPSNVLVAEADDGPLAKVIDFGIAKAIGRDRDSGGSFTTAAFLLGTPACMSPEQTEPGSQDIDTRTDIYSLGVLLYELLAGSPPFRAEDLRDAGYDEMRRILREVDPPRPSAALAASSGGRGDSLQAARKLRGELDWIVMKAMEKDRRRRYETAGALAQDVRRYLDDEPVRACPSSRRDVLLKLARRHKSIVASAVAAAIGTLVLIGTLAVSNVLIRREQGRTRGERDRAEKALLLAGDRADQIRRGFEDLKLADTLVERGRWYSGESRWDDAHNALTRASILRPDHAPVWVELGSLHARLGLWDLAAEDFARELATAPPDTTFRWYLHALICLSQGDAATSRRLVREARERFRGTMNYPFMIDLARMGCIDPGDSADSAEVVRLAETIAPRDWLVRYILGMAHLRAGRAAEAVDHLHEALNSGDAHASRPLVFPALAIALHRSGRTAEARRALDSASEALDRWAGQIYGSEADGRWVHNLGAGVTWPVPWWDWMECRLIHAEASRLILAQAPPADFRLSVLRARAWAALRRHDEADVAYRVAMARLPDSPRLRLEAHRNRAYARARVRDWAGASAEFAAAVALRPGEVHLHFFHAVSAMEAGDRDAYRDICSEMLDRFETTNDPLIASYLLRACALAEGPPDPRILGSPLRLARTFGYLGASASGAALYRAGRHDEAVSCLEEAARVFHLRASEWCILALARHRMGDDKAALLGLNKARRWIDEADNADSDDPTGIRPSWGAWYEQAIYARLLLEAERAIRSDGPLGDPRGRQRP